MNTIYLLALAAAAPIAGIVGFAIQLRQVRKAQLENEKLLLEIAALKAAQTASQARVIAATTDEVIRYNNLPMFSRGRGPNQGSDWQPSEPSISGRLVGVGVSLLAILVVCYVADDIYRFIGWVASVFVRV